MDTIDPQEKLWNSNYIKVWIGNFLLYFAFMLLTPLLPLYLTDTYGADKQVIGIVLSGYAVAALLIRPFSGFLWIVFPRKMMLLIFYFLTAAFFGGYLMAGSLTALLCSVCSMVRHSVQRVFLSLRLLSMSCPLPEGRKVLVTTDLATI